MISNALDLVAKSKFLIIHILQEGIDMSRLMSFKDRLNYGFYGILLTELSLFEVRPNHSYCETLFEVCSPEDQFIILKKQ